MGFGNYLVIGKTKKWNISLRHHVSKCIFFQHFLIPSEDMTFSKSMAKDSAAINFSAWLQNLPSRLNSPLIRIKIRTAYDYVGVV